MGFKVAGLSKDGVASHAKFAAKLALGYPLLADPETRLIQALGAWAEKKLYGKSSFGAVRSTFVAEPRGRLLQVFPKAKSAGHAAEVLKALGGGD